MNLRLAAVGLLAGTLAVPALASDQHSMPQPRVNSDTQSASQDTSETARTAGTDAAESSPGNDAAAGNDAPVESSPSEPGDGANETEESAASASASRGADVMDIQTEETRTIDPNKAKPKEIEAYNATVAPDDRIVCRRDRESAGVGARFSQKVCRTARQWRELGR